MTLIYGLWHRLERAGRQEAIILITQRACFTMCICVRWPIGKRLQDAIFTTANTVHIFENTIQQASRPTGLHFISWAFESEQVLLFETHAELFFSRFLRPSPPQPWPSQPLTFPEHHYLLHYMGKYRDFMIIGRNGKAKYWGDG